MILTTQWAQYGAEPFTGYFCHWAGARSLPAVIVLQEAWGVDAHIEDVVQRFARAGYAVLAPDLFAKSGNRPASAAGPRMREVRSLLDSVPAAWMDPAAREAELAKRPEDERARINESLAALTSVVGSLPAQVPAVVAAARWLRTECEVTRGRKVGSVGFCMGGGLSALLAAHDPELAGAVIYYGMSPPLDLVPKIPCPVLGIYGGLDARVNGGVPAFAEAMKQNGKSFEPVTYEGAKHAFFNDERPSYDIDASRDAFARTLEFFRGALHD
jgi:carboxymethylenebutenolidase